MTKYLVNVKNSLDKKQKKEISDKLEKLIRKYQRLSVNRERLMVERGEVNKFNSHSYMEGVCDGLKHAYKLVNELQDSYNEV